MIPFIIGCTLLFVGCAVAWPSNPRITAAALVLLCAHVFIVDPILDARAIKEIVAECSCDSLYAGKQPTPTPIEPVEQECTDAAPRPPEREYVRVTPETLVPVASSFRETVFSYAEQISTAYEVISKKVQNGEGFVVEIEYDPND